MTAQDILSTEDFKKCISFHGHLCPGLTLGYLASKAGMDWLKQNRSEDEEIVAIVETDACCADAVQVLTGCTFGKGNFIYKDHGKFVFTFLSRKTGDGIRISLKENPVRNEPEFFELMKKFMNNTATNEERTLFNQKKMERTNKLLETPFEALFDMKPVNMEIPSKAKVEPSKPCSVCGEPTMPSKMNDNLVCRGCV